MLAADNPESIMTKAEITSEWKRDTEDRPLHRVAKVHHVLEICQGSQILHATQRKSHAQNQQITANQYISDTYEIFRASRPIIQHSGAAAFVLSE
jgi:hypothetical protein